MPASLSRPRACTPPRRPRPALAGLAALALLAGFHQARAHATPEPARNAPAAASPVVTGIAPALARPGDILQVFGHHLDQVVAIRLGSPATPKIRDLQVTHGGTVLTCVIPARDLPPDGAAFPIACYFRVGANLHPAPGAQVLRLLPAPPANAGTGAPAGAFPAAGRPVVTGIAPAVARPGDTLQVFGQHLDRVVAVRLGAPEKVRNLRVSHGGTVLTCVIPAQDLPPDGNDVPLACYVRHGDTLARAAGSQAVRLLPAPPPAPAPDRGLAIPAVTGMVPAEARPGERLALFGQHLDRVAKVRLGAHGLLRQLRVSEGGTVLTGVLPARGLPPDGAAVALTLTYRFTADGAIRRSVTLPRRLQLLPAAVAAPGTRPQVTGLDPAWGPPGTLVTLTGQHLDQVDRIHLGNGQVFLDKVARSANRLVFRAEGRSGAWSQAAALPVTLATAPVAGRGRPGHQVVAGTFQLLPGSEAGDLPGSGAGDPAGPGAPVSFQGRMEPGTDPGTHRFQIVGRHLPTIYAARVNDRPCALEHLADRLQIAYRPGPGDPAPGAARITLAYRGGSFQAPVARSLELVCPQTFSFGFRPLAAPAGPVEADGPAIHQVEPAQARPGEEVILHGRALDRVTRLHLDGFGAIEHFQPHPSGSRALARLPRHWRPEPGAQAPFRLGRPDGPDLEAKARLLVLAGPEPVAPAAAGDLDVRLACLYVTQAVQSQDGQVPLVQGRDACLRVFPVAGRANRAQPRVRVTVRDGAGQVRLEQIVDLSGTGVPTRIDEGGLRGSYVLPLPGELVQPGLAVTAQLLDGPGGPLTVAPAVVAVPPVRLTLIPIRVAGRVGRVVGDGRTLDHWLETVRKVFPIGQLEVRVGAVWEAPADSADGSDGMARLVRALEARRTLADPWNLEYHFGVLPQTDSHCLGLTHAYCGQASSLGRSMVGLDGIGAEDPDRFHRTLAHELGHALGLDHAPAGGAQAPDPRYPVPDGHLDCAGFDLANRTPIGPRTCRDIMAYGGFRWISAYHWRRVLDTLTTGFELHSGRKPAAPAGSGPVLRVSGSIRDGRRVLWHPAIEQPPQPAQPALAGPPEPGPYRLLALDADGFVLADLPFQARGVAGQGLEHFEFTVPVTEALRVGLASFQVHRDGRRLPLVASWTGKPLAPAGSGLGLEGPPAPVARRAADGTVTVAWNTDLHPEGLALDGHTGARLGSLSTWSRTLRTDAVELDLRMSDGVRTTRFRVPVLPGV